MSTPEDISGPVLVWFRQDLRIADHAALHAAAATGRPVIPLFILDPDAGLGGASKWWLHRSLNKLGPALATRGTPLVLRQGTPATILKALVEDTKARAVYWSKGYDGISTAQDETIGTWLREHDVEARLFRSTLLFEPGTIKTHQGGLYQNFTPFWRACRDAPPPADPLAEPLHLPAPKHAVKSDKLDSWSLLPIKPNWAKGFEEVWTPGEAAAAENLHDFLDDRLQDYAAARDNPAIEGTSRLSPHLHWGEISPRQIWHATLHAQGKHGGRLDSGADRFLTELGWREFSYSQLSRHHDLDTRPLRPAFEDFPWQNDESLLKAWQQGRTGYPLVDAGMRELWHTGWMHNRVRLVVASFLVKHLLQPWQDGERWFWDCLVDADKANNAANWQWVAGCGADAAPYFRIFNPILQGKKFDPTGNYIRKWIPEIASRDGGLIHEPIADAKGPRFIPGRGAIIGPKGSYPPPIVDHDEARKRALAALATISGGERKRSG